MPAKVKDDAVDDEEIRTRSLPVGLSSISTSSMLVPSSTARRRRLEDDEAEEAEGISGERRQSVKIVRGCAKLLALLSCVYMYVTR